MTILNPLYVAHITAMVDGEEQSAGQIIADNRKAEGIRETLVRAITECPAYEGAHQLTAFTKKRFGDPEECPDAKAMQDAWDANVVHFGEYYLTEGERHAIDEYTRKMKEMREMYKPAYISEMLKFDSVLAEMKKEANDAQGKLSSFMSKVRGDLEKYDAGDAGESETRTKRSKLAIKASHVAAILASENKGPSIDCIAEEYDTLYGMLERWAKADKGAAVYLSKLQG